MVKLLMRKVLTRGLRCSNFDLNKDLEKLQNVSIFTNIAMSQEWENI